MRNRVTLSALAGTLIMSSSGLAAIEVIYCEVPGHPKATVPTGPALSTFAEFDLFDRPFVSPDGVRWLLQAETNGATTEDRVLITFDGTTASTVLREGLQAPWAASGELVGFIDTGMSINNAGQFCFINNTSATTADDYVVGFDGADFITVAQEGQPATGGGNWGATMGSAHVLGDGTFCFDSTASAGGSRMLQGTTIVGQSTVTILTNQPLGQTQTFSSLTTNFFRSSDNGVNTMYRCNLNGDTTVDEVIAVNGRVVLNEGMTITGMSAPINTTYGFDSMSFDGDWMVRGSTTDNEDYVVRNGTLLTRTGDPIIPASTELFDDTTFAACYFWQYENSVGDYIVGGVTDAADVNANAVLVMNGTDVVARENDMIDLNGNGLPDDDAFIGVFNNDDGFLTDDRQLCFTVDMRDGAGTALGQAFLRIDLGETKPCLGDTDADGDVDADDLTAVILQWGNTCPCTGDVDNDNDVDADDLVLVVLNWGKCP